MMYKRIVAPSACALSNAKWAVLLSLAALIGQQVLADGRGAHLASACD